MYIRDINRKMKPYIEKLGKVEAIRKHFPFSEGTYYDMIKGRYKWTNRKAIKIKEELVEWLESDGEK